MRLARCLLGLIPFGQGFGAVPGVIQFQKQSAFHTAKRAVAHLEALFDFLPDKTLGQVLQHLHLLCRELGLQGVFREYVNNTGTAHCGPGSGRVGIGPARLLGRGGTSSSQRCLKEGLSPARLRCGHSSPAGNESQGGQELTGPDRLDQVLTGADGEGPADQEGMLDRRRDDDCQLWAHGQKLASASDAAKVGQGHFRHDDFDVQARNRGERGLRGGERDPEDELGAGFGEPGQHLAHAFILVDQRKADRPPSLCRAGPRTPKHRSATLNAVLRL